MNKKLAIILSIFLICSVPINVNAQKGKKKSVATKTNKTTTINKNGGSVRMFEGELKYLQYHCVGNLLKVLSSFDMGIWNGKEYSIVYVKGKSVHVFSESRHFHSIYLPEQNVVYHYSDITKTGIKGTMKDAAQYGMLDPNHAIAEPEQRISTFQSTNETVEHNGNKCIKFTGYLKRDEESKADVEMWCLKKYHITDSYRYFLSGLPVPGIVSKGITTQLVYLPIAGKNTSATATELTGVKEYKVPATMMRPPSDVRITSPSADEFNNSLLSLHKEHKAALKKAKMSPETMSKKDVKNYIRSQWSQYDEWMAQKLNSKTDIQLSSTDDDEGDDDISVDGLDEQNDVDDNISNDKSLSQEAQNRIKRVQKRRKELRSTINKEKTKYLQLTNVSKAEVILKANQDSRMDAVNSLLESLITHQEEFLLAEEEIKALRKDGDFNHLDESAAKRHVATQIKSIRRKYEDRKKTLFAIFNLAPYLDEYRQLEKEIEDIKKSHGNYMGWTKRQQIDKVHKNQKKMKQLRQKYTSKAKSSFSGFSSNLEDWNIEHTSPWNKE